MDKQPVEKINALIILGVVSSLMPWLLGVACLLLLTSAEPVGAFWDHGGAALVILALGAVVVLGIPFALAAIIFGVGALRRRRTHRMGWLGTALTWLGLALGSTWILAVLIFVALALWPS